MKLANQFLAFVSVGVVNTLVGFTIIIVLANFFLVNAMVSNFLGYMAGLSVSFILNKNWTFKQNIKRNMIYKYIGAFMISYSINLIVLNMVLGIWPERMVIAQALAITSYTVLFFLLCRCFVFFNVKP